MSQKKSTEHAFTDCGYTTLTNGYPVPVFQMAFGAYCFALPVAEVAAAWRVCPKTLAAVKEPGAFIGNALVHGMIAIGNLRRLNLAELPLESVAAFYRWCTEIYAKQFRCRYLLDLQARHYALRDNPYAAVYTDLCMADLSKEERVALMAERDPNYKDPEDLQLTIVIHWLFQKSCQTWISQSLCDEDLPPLPKRALTLPKNLGATNEK